VFIETEEVLLDVLSTLPPDECANYVFVPFDEWTRVYSSLILRKERGDILESMNLIVAERMSYVNGFIQSFHLDEECHKHIFPVNKPDPIFMPLKLLEITGALAFLLVFLCISVFIFIVEMISAKWSGAEMDVETEFPTFNIQFLQVDKTFSCKKRKEIGALYLRILEVIDE
jgi:hypothetical protein